MNESTEENPSNVIEVSFSPRNENLSFEREENPSELSDGQRFEDNLDSDPLEDLLNEFEDLDESDFVEDTKDFILDNRNDEQFNFSYKDDPVHMTEVLLKQNERLNEDLKRLSYYLDEMNFES